jgi:hypothetical protein
LPGVRVGDVVLVRRRGEPLACEIVGFERARRGMALGALAGAGPDDEVVATGGPLNVRANAAHVDPLWSRRTRDRLALRHCGGTVCERLTIAIEAPAIALKSADRSFVV